MHKTRHMREIRFSSNAVRLSLPEWLIAAGFILVIAAALPPLWKHLETFSLPVDYRIPYRLSEDYWLFERFSRSVCGKDKILVIGDSVIWGHYVNRDRTLSHSLNELAGEERFVNLGLDGTHPMALYGLLRHYGRAVKGEKILLHLNLLWLSSEEADLQSEKEQRFNHPRLVPQFRPRIPGYTESVSGRIGIVLERALPLFQLVRHLHVSNFDSTDLPLWTVENPYANPLGRISFKTSGAGERGEKIRSETQPEREKPQVQQSLPWVDLETSLQWWAFGRLLELLEDRGNDVFVAVGPLNEHALDSDSLQKYRALVLQAGRYLEEKDVLYLNLPPLPAHQYIDMSHPGEQGYQRLAEHIWNRMKR